MTKKTHKMPQKQQAQVSTEYLTVIAFVMVAITALLFVSLYFSRTIQDQIAITQADKLVKEITDGAESVFYLGTPAMKTIKATIPERVESIKFANREVTITLRTKEGNTDVSYTSPVKIVGSVPTGSGLRYIKVQAKNGCVWVHT